MSGSPTELFAAGQLTEAIAAGTEAVKRKPMDASARGLLAELLCIAGNWERADVHLDALLRQEPEAAPGISLLRQLVRAAQARDQFYSEGRIPEFLTEPGAWVRLHLEASVLLRDGRPAEAAARIEQAESERPVLKGECNGQRFEGLRDLDDLTSGLFEVLTSTGKYFWIPMETVELVEFRAPSRPRDLLWRRARMSTRDGTDGEVFIPAIYAAGGQDLGDAARLGHSTDWLGGEGEPVRGTGQRMFLFGDEDISIMEVNELAFDENT
ncbi:MAG: type VI secretion system accessory protein TagJ [Gammaproteobacteria bacterium]